MSEMNELNQTLNNNEAFISYGKVLSCKDGIIEVAGLHDVMAGEVVKFGDDQMGMISNLEKNSVSAIVLGDDTAICQGDLVTSTGSQKCILITTNFEKKLNVENVFDCVMAVVAASFNSQIANFYKFARVKAEVLYSKIKFNLLPIFVVADADSQVNVGGAFHKMIYDSLIASFDELIFKSALVLVCIFIVQVCIKLQGKEWFVVDVVLGTTIGFIIGAIVSIRY